MNWLAALLTWFAADPQAIDTERPRAAACVMAAHASMAKENKRDAPEDTDAQAELGEPGGGRAAEPSALRSDTRDGNSSRLLRQEAPPLAAGCADGKCVAVPRVRTNRR